jgi:Type I restriction modification DNA specificity domain
MSELPKGWTDTTIGAVCHLVNGRAFKPSDWGETGLPIVRIQNLNRPDAKFNYYAGEVRDRFLIEAGDLLFAWSGTPGTSFGAHIWNGPKAILNQHIFNVSSIAVLLIEAFCVTQLTRRSTNRLRRLTAELACGTSPKACLKTRRLLSRPSPNSAVLSRRSTACRASRSAHASSSIAFHVSWRSTSRRCSLWPFRTASDLGMYRTIHSAFGLCLTQRVRRFTVLE